MLSWVSPVLGWALKCLAQGHSHEKTQRIQCGSNPGPLDYESNILPLSHAGHYDGRQTQHDHNTLCSGELKMLVAGIYFFFHIVFKHFLSWVVKVRILWPKGVRLEPFKKRQLSNFSASLSEASPNFYVSAVQIFRKQCFKSRNCLLGAISPFPTDFSTY